MKKKYFSLCYADPHIFFLLLCTKILLKFEYVEGYLYLYAYQYSILTIHMENESISMETWSSSSAHVILEG